MDRTQEAQAGGHLLDILTKHLLQVQVLKKTLEVDHQLE